MGLSIRSKLPLENPPIDVPADNIRKSVFGDREVRKLVPSVLGTVGPEGRLAFLTKGVKAIPLREKPTPNIRYPILSMGDPRQIAPSAAVWGRAKWELHIYFTLHNLSENKISVYDFHSNVYHVSDKILPLAMVIHADRIEVFQDNSIVGSGMSFDLEPCEMQHVDLVVETSLYDTLMTTIVFGIFADYQCQENSTVVRRRIPSDKIYIFQHHEHTHGTENCHFVGRNLNDIRARAAEDPGDASVQNFTAGLLEAYELHIQQAVESPSSPQLSLPRPPLPGHVSPSPVSITPIDAATEASLVSSLPHGLKSAENSSPRAPDLLRLCSFLGADRIPKTLLAESYYQLSMSMYDKLRKERLFSPSSIRGLLVASVVITLAVLAWSRLVPLIPEATPMRKVVEGLPTVLVLGVFALLLLRAFGKNEVTHPEVLNKSRRKPVGGTPLESL